MSCRLSRCITSLSMQVCLAGTVLHSTLTHTLLMKQLRTECVVKISSTTTTTAIAENREREEKKLSHLNG